MTADLAAKIAAAREVLASLPAEKWEHVEEGRIYLADGGMIASVHAQIPDYCDPDGDDPEAWEIGDAAVEEAGRRAEAVSMLVNARTALLDLAEAAYRYRDSDPALYRHLDSALARLAEVMP